ncbi:MAG: hypothetical protein WBA36_06085, partial [Mesorhizobium sp.]
MADGHGYKRPWQADPGKESDQPDAKEKARQTYGRHTQIFEESMGAFRHTDHGKSGKRPETGGGGRRRRADFQRVDERGDETRIVHQSPIPAQTHFLDRKNKGRGRVEAEQGDDDHRRAQRPVFGTAELIGDQEARGYSFTAAEKLGRDEVAGRQDERELEGAQPAPTPAGGTGSTFDFAASAPNPTCHLITTKPGTTRDDLAKTDVRPHATSTGAGSPPEDTGFRVASAVQPAHSHGPSLYN